MASLPITINSDTILGIIGIILAIVIPIVGSILWVARKLDRIETNTEPIKAINDTMIRLDERTMNLPTQSHGTVVVTLKNLGKVSVSATPINVQLTQYSLQFEKPIKFDGIASVSRQTGLAEKEKEIFGKSVQSVRVGPTHLIMQVPSSDAKICSEYVSIFLKWLDSDYLPHLEKSLAEYEQIKV